MRISLLLILLTLTLTPSFAQDGERNQVPENGARINLEQAIQIALANNTQMKQALLSVRDADQQIRTAWSQVMPDVAASVNYTRNLEVPVNFIPEVVFNPDGDPNTLVPVAFGTDNNWNGGFTVSQTIFSGQAFVGISSSEVYKAAQSENLRATSQGVVTQTRIAYYQLLMARENIRLAEAQLDRVQQNLSDTRALYEEGFTDEYAVLQLEVQLSNLEPQLSSARYALDSARRDLLDVMGLPLQLELIPEGDLNTFQISNESAETDENSSLKKIDQSTPLLLDNDSLLTDKASELRGDLRILDIQQQLNEKQLKAQKSQFLPTLSASYNLQWSAAQAGNPVFFGSEDQRARSQTLMLNFRLPIFQGFSRNANIQMTQIQSKNLEIQEHQAMKSATKEILNAQQSMEEAIQNSSARMKALEQAKRGYDRALKRYQSGLGSQQEVTDADLQLRQAETNYAQMVFGYLSAKAQYDQAIGQVPFVSEDTRELKENIQLN